MRGRRSKAVVAIGLSLLFAPASRAAIVTTIEAPGVQTSSAIDKQVINFDSAGQGWHYQQVFNLTGLTVTYDGNQFVEKAGQYGGAGGTGQYLGVQQDTPEQDDSVTISLSTPQAYFGLWFSAADPYNKIQIYNGSTLLYTFTGTGSEMSALPGTYLGNPNSAFLGQNGTQNYAFVNFYAQTSGDMFNKIVLTNLYGGGTELESDNHTFSATLQPVPEPSSIASIGIAVLMLSGRWIQKKRRVSSGI